MMANNPLDRTVDHPQYQVWLATAIGVLALVVIIAAIRLRRKQRYGKGDIAV